MCGGARQVGKTWTINEFGNSDFRRAHYLAFDRTPSAGSAFTQGKGPEDTLKSLSLLFGADIDPAHDLLILDEIQECPQALTSLKHFAEEIPQLPICCAGSHIGLTLSDASFPVGKVDILDMYPMGFWNRKSSALRPWRSFAVAGCFRL
ncbi:MAG: AAA family ATPase [Chitinivibrionales bacterium]|nr:AAA family ATPase [Chitinivibrionales bacterium]